MESLELLTHAERPTRRSAFRVNVPEEISSTERRLAATRWPTKRRLLIFAGRAARATAGTGALLGTAYDAKAEATLNPTRSS